MKVTVCEFPDEASRRDAAWTNLVRFLKTSPTDVVVLPEMPSCDWKILRATSGHRRWPMAASLAAVVYESEAFAGRSWLVSPEGEILAETSADTPYLEEANRAKHTYPRNLVIP